MTQLSIMIEGQDGLTWPHWKTIVEAVDSLGFAGLMRSDHYTNADPPNRDSLEMIVSQVYLADHSKNVHFGPMVAPFSFREPTMLARQAAAIDDLSGGRFIIGMGAGWQEREHNMFGFNLASMKERMDRFEEGCEVVTQLLKSDEPVSFEGKYYNLREAILLPRPQRPGGPQILIGGSGPQRTMPLVARYADIWNGVYMSKQDFSDRSKLLDQLLVEQGRKPEDVKRTMMMGVIFGRTREDLEKWLSRPQYQNRPELEGKTIDEKMTFFQGRGLLIGNGEEIAAQIKGWADLGLEEIMTQWFQLDDIATLRAYAEDVLPLISGR